MTDINKLAAAVGQQLQVHGAWLSTAESCTGGMVAAALTDIAGSSAWFAYGLVSYSNAAKQRLLGVSEQTLAEHGAVSEAVVRQMAAGAQALAKADWSIAISGIAGPGGGSVTKPVGTVWFALAGPQQFSEAFCCYFSGDRAAVRQQAVRECLTRLLARLQQPLMV
ncbi:nicotinamide-nucleotide amidohydrolase family protein [Neisseriaceae bacterium TC5R-5]|nr:nicotinamide-nucleotide amidohydrolase family protein [Neisseriaceae bacterium TC5R-5]